MKKKKKVYCCNCKHILATDFEIYFTCRHPKNTATYVINPFYSPKTSREYMMKPEKLNKRNKCRWYEEK